jgi:hypothetical protein
MMPVRIEEDGVIKLPYDNRRAEYRVPVRDIPDLEAYFDTAMPSDFSDCDSGPERLTHHLPGAVRSRFAWIESLERPERPTQTCGKHEGSLIVPTLRSCEFFVEWDQRSAGPPSGMRRIGGPAFAKLTGPTLRLQ